MGIDWATLGMEKTAFVMMIQRQASLKIIDHQQKETEDLLRRMIVNGELRGDVDAEGEAIEG
jgi:hypothetical protein